MAKPVPSADQMAAIQSTAAQAQAKKTNLAAAADAQDAVIAKAQAVDDAFKNLFNWYNDSIIAKYDAERKALNGVYIETPIVEADLTGVGANPPTGRLVPTAPAKDIVRISQFDGTPTTTTTANETQHIADQGLMESYLAIGGTGRSPVHTSGTTKTDSALTPASTSLLIHDSAQYNIFTPGDIFMVDDGATVAALVRVETVVDLTAFPGIAPYDYQLGITVLGPASFTTIPGGTDLEVNWVGFTNTERTNKVASVPRYQGIMDALIASLSAAATGRVSRLTEQLAALVGQDDPDGTAQTATATTNATTSKTFLQSYLSTTLVTDVALASLATERGVRSPQVATRITQINGAYTGQTDNYYDKRYEVANNRGHLQRGTMREVTNAQNAKDVVAGIAAGMGDGIDALNSML